MERNGSSLIAFIVGDSYKSGDGVAIVAGHVDALTARLKPVSTKKTTAGYLQLGVAPYAGALNTTWWDRDLGVGGRVVVKDPDTGKITTRLVKLDWPSKFVCFDLGDGRLISSSCENPNFSSSFRRRYAGHQ